MANKRMFSLDVIDTDQFLEMPVSARCLYYDLGMRADDDGFVSPRKVIRLTNTTDDDLRVLIVKNFVIPFESGVIVITHWKQNNLLRGDRYRPTVYQTEFSNLQIVNDCYKVSKNTDEVKRIDTSIMHTTGIPLVAIGKDRIGKDSIVKSNTNVPFAQFLSKFNSLFNSEYRETPKRKTQLANRLKTYPIEQILKAVEILASLEFYQGKNDRGWKADPDFVLRSDEQIDKFLNHEQGNHNNIKLKNRIADLPEGLQKLYD